MKSTTESGQNSLQEQPRLAPDLERSSGGATSADAAKLSRTGLTSLCDDCYSEGQKSASTESDCYLCFFGATRAMCRSARI